MTQTEIIFSIFAALLLGLFAGSLLTADYFERIIDGMRGRARFQRRDERGRFVK